MATFWWVLVLCWSSWCFFGFFGFVCFVIERDVSKCVWCVVALTGRTCLSWGFLLFEKTNFMNEDGTERTRLEYILRPATKVSVCVCVFVVENGECCESMQLLECFGRFFDDVHDIWRGFDDDDDDWWWVYLEIMNLVCIDRRCSWLGDLSRRRGPEFFRNEWEGWEGCLSCLVWLWARRTTSWLLLHTVPLVVPVHNKRCHVSQSPRWDEHDRNNYYCDPRYNGDEGATTQSRLPYHPSKNNQNSFHWKSKSTNKIAISWRWENRNVLFPFFFTVTQRGGIHCQEKKESSRGLKY